jgi:hypothetical protein
VGQIGIDLDLVDRRDDRRHKPGPRDDEVRRLRAEVARLSDLLRENGIEPGDAGRQTA